ncbi:hypothetical protein NAV33_18705 [Pseudomonas stutzeri]|uniref:hypothetical protein n=1 Tax=Stutzerimonas stutzeri TaxID=316 RepID=UPI002108B04E|nr:hypothetical protein [Stutzerimonas stutzeri]MCQ4313903.1 hypothetical protein [Stutzerimonas stutzeri]
MKSKKDKVQKKRKQSNLSRVLASSKSAYQVRKNFFEKLDPVEIRSSVKSLASHIHFKQAISLKDLKFSKRYMKQSPDTSLEKNIAWCLGVLELFKADLQIFLDTSSTVEQLILSEQLDEALQQLDFIDRSCGLSFWSIGIRSAILSISGRKEEKQLLLENYMNLADNNAFLKSITRMIINKFEENDGLSSESMFTEQKIKRTYSGPTLHLLMFKALPLNTDFDYDYNHILNIEKHTSAIDILVCLIDLVSHSITSEHGSKYQVSARRISIMFSRSFHSAHLAALATAFEIECEWHTDSSDCEILEMYTEGRYSELLSKTVSHDQAYKFSIFSIIASSACRHPHSIGGLQGNLVNAATSLLLKTENFEEATAFLSLLTNSLGKLPWFRLLQLFLLRESKFSTPLSNSLLYNAQGLLADINSPRKYRYLPESLKDSFLQAITPTYRNTSIYNLFLGELSFTPVLERLVGVEQFRAKKYIAQDLYDQGKADDAIRLLETITPQDDQLIYNDASKLLILANIRAFNTPQAIDLYVNLGLENPRLLKTLDSNSICSSAEKIIDSSKSITVPIALSLHTRFIADNHIAALRYSFECFLSSNELQTPLELFDNPPDNSAHFYYFAEHICTPEVMKLYLNFDTARDVENCRIEICKRLIKLGISTELMIAEVKDRTRKIVLHDAAKHVENSKIYSDTTSFNTSPEFQSIFAKYQRIRLDHTTETADDVELGSFVEGVKSQSDLISSAHLIHIQNIVLGEKNSLFFKLLKLMRDEFAFGTKGLGGFLSTRIRHGHFPNTLRKCAADEGLLSPKATSAGGYKKNLLWIDRLSPLSREQESSIDKYLTEFASRFDELINHANDKWLNITIVDQDVAGLRLDEIENEAQFNYSCTYLDAHLVQLKISEATSYQDFARIVTEWLWTRTEYNLGRVRSKISKEFREGAFRRVDKLEKDITDTIKDQAKLVAFQESIVRLRQRLASSIDTVIAWFERSRGHSISHFDTDVAMQIACMSADAKIDFSDSTNIQFQGRSLTYIVDVLYVILENCVTKSNLPREGLMISGTLRLIDDILELVIENNCAPVGDYMMANAALGTYRERYGKESYMLPASRSQGGTGFFKIWKALSNDLDLAHTLEFGYTSTSSFRVKLLISEIKKVIQS